jgi:hypothetical protein
VSMHITQAGKIAQNYDAHITTGRKKFTVGKIDKLNYPVNHGIAKGYQGIQSAKGQSVNQLLNEIFHIF